VKKTLLFFVASFFISTMHGVEISTDDCIFVAFMYKGNLFRFFDYPDTSSAANIISGEIRSGAYTIEDFDGKPGDVMVDIGAHVGMASILYAKLHPQMTIYAFEPMPSNYQCLLKNIKMNNVEKR